MIAIIFCCYFLGRWTVACKSGSTVSSFYQTVGRRLPIVVNTFILELIVPCKGQVAITIYHTVHILFHM